MHICAKGTTEIMRQRVKQPP